MKLTIVYLIIWLITSTNLSRADTFNIRDGSADFVVNVSRYIGDHSVVFRDYKGDYDISVKKGDCSNEADHSISITKQIADYSVVISEQSGDFSAVIVGSGGDHTVCVPNNSSRKEIEEYVAVVVIVAALKM